MSIYPFQEAHQHFAQLLEEAKTNTVMVTNQNGEMFAIQFITKVTDSTDKPQLTCAEIVDYVRESRERA